MSSRTLDPPALFWFNATSRRKGPQAGITGKCDGKRA